MARIAALRTLPAIALVAALFMLCGSAAAQAYPRVHVIALAQRSDRGSVAPGEVFHVTIHVKIAEVRDRLDELILGSFENCEIISNETIRTATTGGTDFVERLTLQALAPGEATISPAYIDAFDPAIGKAMRFSANAVRVQVTGPAALPVDDRELGTIVQRLLLAVAIVLGFAAAVFVLGVMFVRVRKRRPPPVAFAGAVPVAATEPVAPDERLIRAGARYRAERSRDAVLDVRGVLFELAGVARGATLIDALHALGERDRPIRSALIAAERAAFGPAGDREAAGDEMLAAIAARSGGAARSPENAWTR